MPTMMRRSLFCCDMGFCWPLSPWHLTTNREPVGLVSLCLGACSYTNMSRGGLQNGIHDWER